MRAAIVAALAFATTAAPAQAAISEGPAQRAPYEVFTIGDSYASGEGAPDVDGSYNDQGHVNSGQYEDWDTRFGGSPATPGPNQDSTRCHRSGHTSTSAVAVADLQSLFPDLSVDWQSVACSGAAIVESGHLDGSQPAHKGGILRGYDGVDNLSGRGISSDNLSPAVYPSQISQLNTILTGRPAGPTRQIDALVMDLGGNDAGFGDVIADCANIFPFKGDCNTDPDVATFVSHSVGALSPTSGNGLYDRLAGSLTGHPLSGTGDPSLAFPPAATFITAAPNPLHPTGSTFCDQQPDETYMRDVKAAEGQWVSGHLADPLNAAMQREAGQHGWTFVNSYLRDFVGHAYCTPAPNNFVNTNLQALHREGRLDLPLVDVSAGIIHPNVAGYADMGQGLFGAMAPAVVAHFTPDVAPATAVTSSATGFGVVFGDDNLAPLASGYWHRVRLRQLNADGSVTNVTGADGSRSFGYGTQAHTYVRTGRYLVTVRSCAPVSRDGFFGCSPPTPEIRVSTFVPATPVHLSTLPGVALGTPTSPSITVNWQYADAFALHDTRTVVVRARRGTTKTSVTRIVPGPATAVVLGGLIDGASYDVSVTACNDGSRCSAPSPEVSEVASSASQFGSLASFQTISLASLTSSCSTSPVVFDPLAPSNVFGISDPFSTFTPTCPGSLPVGRISLVHRLVTTRRGRPAKVAVRWRHPRRWRDLREIDVVLAGAHGPAAKLRFDRRSGTIALGRTHLRLGRAGTLHAAGLSVRLGRSALQGSGPRGTLASLRFAVRTRRSLAISVGATDESGVVQPPVPAGAIRVRSS